jgi:hypothetical protein
MAIGATGAHDGMNGGVMHDDDLLTLRSKISALEEGARAVLQVNGGDLPCICAGRPHAAACCKLRVGVQALKRGMEMPPRSAAARPGKGCA